MDPDLERLEREFSVNIDRWLSKQGILFQMSHSSGSGSILPKLFSLFIRLVIFLLIVLIVFWFYLRSRPSSEGFAANVTQNVEAGTNAASIKLKGVQRYGGGLLDAQLKISSIALGGSETSFFEDWYVDENVEKGNSFGSENSDSIEDFEDNRRQLMLDSVFLSPLGIGDSLITGWSVRDISIGVLNCQIKTGAETDAAAEKSYASMFKEYDSLNIRSVNIEEATIRWGYDLSKGGIKGSKISAVKKYNVWEIEMIGGKFSHGWLQGAEINRMVVECHKNGVVKILNADLKLGSGSFTFDAEIQVKAKPLINGNYQFKGVKVLDLVGDVYKGWIDGQLKGQGALTGSLNSFEGVISTTKVMLSASASADAGDNKTNEMDNSYLIVRSKFPLLSTMQRINNTNSYNLLRFNLGEFVIEQSGKDTLIKDIKIRSNDLLLVNGNMSYNWVTLKEKRKREIDANTKLKTTFDKIEVVEDGDLASNSLINERLVKIFSGDLNIGFIPNVFDDHPAILKVYPEDKATIRVWIPVKMAGDIYEVSSQSADELEKIVRDARDEKENN